MCTSGAEDPMGPQSSAPGRSDGGLQFMKPGTAQQVLARTDRTGPHRSAARGRSIQRLGRLEREAARIVGGIDHAPQQMAPSGGTARARRRLRFPATSCHPQMRRREQAVGHIPGQTGEPGGTPIIHVHPGRAHRGRRACAGGGTPARRCPAREARATGSRRSRRRCDAADRKARTAAEQPPEGGR